MIVGDKMENKTEKQVKSLLKKIRPYLQRDGGDLEYLKMDNGVVYVRLLGACVGCGSQDDTLKLGIEAMLVDNVPGVIEVRNVD